jgi:hypothetical protein
LKQSLAKLLTSVVAIGLSIAALELGVRIVDGVGMGLRNYVSYKLSLFASAYPSAYDPLLGYVPRPGYRGMPEIWHTRVTINSSSLRQNRTDEADHRQSVILAVGDSFTFGDGVSDEETWPAQLEEMTGLPVANGGVFGYGLDQIVLRAEKLVSVYRPSLLVVSFIFDDVSRNMLAQRTGVEKPYFDVVNSSELVLRNVPPSPNRPHIKQIGLLRTIFGYSYLADWSARRLGASAWWYTGYTSQLFVDTDGPLVACLLMSRLKALEVRTGIKTLIVAQYPKYDFPDPIKEDLQGTANVLECAQKVQLATLDTRERLLAAYREAPREFLERQFRARNHMSAAGNVLIAQQIADWIKNHPLVSSSQGDGASRRHAVAVD